MAANELRGTLTTTDEVDLRWRAWLPAGRARAIFFIVHGLFEHSERYESVADHLRGLGYACGSLDLRGHGRSGGRRVHATHFDDYARDIDTVLAEVRSHLPEVPVILFGHSMGGVIAIRYALDRGDELHGLVLSAPGLAPHADSKPPEWLATLGRALSRVLPRLRIDADLDPSFISRRPEVVAAYSADPLIGTKVSTRWFTAYEAARDDAFERAASLEVPTLLMIAGSDRLVDPEAQRAWSRRVPRELIRVESFEASYHELLNDRQSRDVLDTIESWLEEHVPKQPGDAP